MKTMNWTFWAPRPDSRDWPCGVVTVTAEGAGRWVRLGWRDFTALWVFDLIYGGLFALGGWGLYFALHVSAQEVLILPFAIGFLLLAPILAVGFYEGSRRLEAGEPVHVGSLLRSVIQSSDKMGGPGLALTVAFLAWLEISLFLFSALLFGETVSLTQFWSSVIGNSMGVAFLVSWLGVGALFSAAIFAATAITVPLLHDREINLMTALGVGLRAVRANGSTMLAWALTLGFLSFVGMGLFFAGLAVAFPVLGHATWHAYRDIVQWKE